jgi:hypothetical protein
MAGALAFLGRCNDADRWDAVHKLHRPDAALVDQQPGQLSRKDTAEKAPPP